LNALCPPGLNVAYAKHWIIAEIRTSRSIRLETLGVLLVDDVVDARSAKNLPRAMHSSATHATATTAPVRFWPSAQNAFLLGFS